MRVGVIGAVVLEGVDRYDHVEELCGEWQGMRLGMDGVDALRDPGIAYALKIIRGAEPEIGGPYLHAEFAMQKDRRHRPAAPEVEDAHPGAQIQQLTQPLGEPERIGAASAAPDHPLRMILIRTRKPIADQERH